MRRYRLELATFAVTVAFYTGFAVALRSDQGDWFIYSNVARSILDGCGVAVSFSGVCEPHFGGNQLPLFPAMVALIWKVAGLSEDAVRGVNIALLAAANAWLVHVVLRVTGERLAAVVVALLVSLSPLQARWFGLLMTEPIALASTTLVLAELLLGFWSGRMRPVWLAATISLAVWSRMDGVLLLVPVGIGACMAGGLRRGAGVMAVVLLAIGVTTGGWAVRNMAVGINPFPGRWMIPDGTQGPRGYLAWTDTWAVDELGRSGAMHFGVNQYHRIQFPDAAFADAGEKAAVGDLLARLKLAEGQRFPADIDAAFAALAESRRAQMGFAGQLRLFAQRLWEMGGELVMPWVQEDGSRRSPTLAALMRSSMYWLFLAGALLTCWRPSTLLSRLCVVTVAFVVARATFFAATVNLEARYMVECLPFVMTGAGLCLILPLLRAWQGGALQGGLLPFRRPQRYDDRPG